MKVVANKTVSTLIGGAALMGSVLWTPTAAACSAEPMLASMCIFGGNFAPRGWALAQGQIMSISQNTALFSLLGTSYGGDGRTSFGLPDTRGRAVIGSGNGPGLSSYGLGQKGGVETVTLTLQQMPSHTHTANSAVTTTVALKANSGTADIADPAGNALANAGRTNIYNAGAPDVNMHANSVSVTAAVTTTLGLTGGGQRHENRMPFIALNYIIALQGTYPSRN